MISPSHRHLRPPPDVMEGHFPMLGGCAEWRERFEATFEANTRTSHIPARRPDFVISASPPRMLHFVPWCQWQWLECARAVAVRAVTFPVQLTKSMLCFCVYSARKHLRVLSDLAYCSCLRFLPLHNEGAVHVNKDI